MPDLDYLKSFHTAAQILPERLWRAAYSLDETGRQHCEEFRIRLGRPFAATVSGKTVYLGEQVILPTKEELEAILDKATECSVHSYLEQLWQGYLTTRHGHRLGICGQAPDSSKRLLRDLSSINLRVARQIRELGEDLPFLREQGCPSILIVAPPGAGKTTLLRELCRRLSYQYRVGVVDDRYEIAACSAGKPRFQLGNCDVISGGVKGEAISMMLRSMSPQIIAVDEVTKTEDCESLMECAGCGCQLLATVHGSDLSDLYVRPIYKKLMEAGIFRQAVIIHRSEDRFRYSLEKLS